MSDKLKKKKAKPKLVKDKKVVPLRERPPSVNNILRDSLTNAISYKKVMVIAQDKEGFLYASWSTMRPTERIFLADFAKAIAMKDITE